MWAKGAIEVLLEIILLRNTSLRLRSVNTELRNKHTLSLTIENLKDKTHLMYLRHNKSLLEPAELPRD